MMLTIPSRFLKCIRCSIFRRRWGSLSRDGGSVSCTVYLCELYQSECGTFRRWSRFCNLCRRRSSKYQVERMARCANRCISKAGWVGCLVEVPFLLHRNGGGSERDLDYFVVFAIWIEAGAKVVGLWGDGTILIIDIREWRVCHWYHVPIALGQLNGFLEWSFTNFGVKSWWIFQYTSTWTLTSTLIEI